jgi:hypothetical protein
LIGVSVEDTLAKISDLADAAEPVAYPEEFNIDTDESSESEEVETVETLASADGTGDGDAGDAGDADDPADPETEVKVGKHLQILKFGSEFAVRNRKPKLPDRPHGFKLESPTTLWVLWIYKSVPSTVYQVYHHPSSIFCTETQQMNPPRW